MCEEVEANLKEAADAWLASAHDHAVRPAAEEAV
jgi:predicted RNase H-like HicB family nuclease